MPLVLAIEPDPRQASVVERVVKGQVRADLVLVDSKDAALASLAARVPDVILVTALIPPRDEDEITAYLKTLPRAGHVQTLAIPLLADTDPEPSLSRRLFKPFGRRSGKASTDGCAPATFGEQVHAYLQRAAEAREDAEIETRPERDPAFVAQPATVEEPVVQESAVETPDWSLDEPVVQVAEQLAIQEPVAAQLELPPAAVGTEVPIEQALSVEPTEESLSAEPIEEPCSAAQTEELPSCEPVEEAAAGQSPAMAGLFVEPQPEPVAETPVEPTIEEVPEPAPPEEPTRWLWTDVRPLPAMMVFQVFLADGREESPVRAHQFQRARPVDVGLLAERSVVPEPEQLPDTVAEAGAPEIDTALWDKLFVALEDRFQEEKAKVASTEAAAAEQARKYIQARKVARRRARKSESEVPSAPRPVRRGANPLDSLRSEIEHLLHKSGLPEPKREPKPQRRAADANQPPIESIEGHVEQTDRPKPARPRAPEPPPEPAEDEWGFADPEQFGFAAVVAKLEQLEAEKQARSAAAAASESRSPRREEPSRVAPLSVWARAVTPEPGDVEPVPFDALGRPAKTDPALRLPDDVVAVRYATGCRIGEVRVAEHPPEPDEGEQPVVLLSKKLLKKPR